MLDKVFLGFVSRAGGGWSGELIIAIQEVSVDTLSVRV